MHKHNELMIREPDLFFDNIHNELNNFLRDTILSPAFSNPLTIKKTSIWRPSVEVKQNENQEKEMVARIEKIHKQHLMDGD